MFLEKLSPHTAGHTISHWQVAENGMWEDAKEIGIQPTPQDIKELKDWMHNASEDIAIEAFLEIKMNNFSFLVFVYNKCPKPRNWIS